VSEPLTEKKRRDLRASAEIASGFGPKATVGVAPSVLLALLDERLTPHEAGAIQAVSEVVRLRARVASLEVAIRPFDSEVRAVFSIHHAPPDAPMALTLKVADGEALVRAMHTPANTEPVFTAAQVRQVLAQVSLDAGGGHIPKDGPSVVLEIAQRLGL
jgi:hypothetical protein